MPTSYKYYLIFRCYVHDGPLKRWQTKPGGELRSDHIGGKILRTPMVTKSL